MVILGLLAFILVFLIIIICGDKGTKSIVTTIIHAVILLISVYLINYGFPPVPVTVITCIIITLVTLYYQNEGGVKSKVSLISVIIVILTVVPLVYFFAIYSNSAGIPGEEYEITDSNGYTRNIGINMISLQISVMFIALIGIVIDTAVAISSSIYEIKEHNPILSKSEILKSSFTVSKAILATSIHTIFYIYIAEYLTLFVQYITEYSFATVINSSSLSKELISISISGIGCALVVPVATILGSVFIRPDSIN